jgi:hypothetical protein
MDDGGWASGPHEHEAAPPPRSLRLTFRYDGESVELVKVERLEMIAPPTVGTAPEAGTHGGEWLVIRDRGGRALSWRVLHDPLGTRVEVHDPERGPSIVTGPAGQGVFEVLVPDLPGAQQAELYVSQQRDDSLQPAERTAVFDLTAFGEEGPRS